MGRYKKVAAFALIVYLCTGATVFAQQNRCTLAVFNLRPTNFEAMGYNSDILYTLISSLENSKSVDVLARRKMEEILFQSGLAQSDNIVLVQKAGNALDVGYVLYGNVTKTGPNINAELHLLDVQKQRVVKAWAPTFAGSEAIMADLPALAKDLEAVIIKGVPVASNLSVPVTKPVVGIDNLICKAENKQVVIEWQFDPSLATAGFNVYRASKPEGPYQFQGRTTERTYSDQRIQSGRHYYYRVGLIQPDGRETLSLVTADLKFIGGKVPHPPLIMSATGYIRRAVIEFVPSLQNAQDKFNISAYEVYRRSDSEPSWQPLFSVGAGMRSKSKLGYSVEDQEIMADGGTFSYAIKSIDHKQHESALSDPVTVTIPNPPEFRLENDNLLRRVEFAWQPLTRALGYYLYRKTDTSDWLQVADIKEADSGHYTDDQDLADDTTYHYHLTAYDSAGQTGMSNIVEARTKARPPLPPNLQAESGLVKSVRLSWTPIDDPDIGGYMIYRGTTAEDLSPIDKVKSYQTDAYIDKGKFLPSFGALLKKGQLFSSLEDGQTYYYAVSGFNLFGGEGDRTVSISAQTKPRPTAVPALTASVVQGEILVNWEQSTTQDISSYIIFRSKNDSDWSKVETVSGDQNSYRDADLKPEIEYRYRIVAEDQDDLLSDPVESNPILSPVAKKG